MSKLKLGLQLFSIRDAMAEDMEGTLKAVSEMGYDCVEFAGYFGKTAEEVKAICEKYNLTPISVHQKYDVFIDNPEESVNYLKTLGVKYCAVPWVSSEDWEKNYDKLIADIKKVGKLLKDNGIQLLYHNHDFEFFVKHGDDCVLDSLYKEVPSDILQPQLDLCWVHYAGRDPVEYVKKYGNVEEGVHIRDFVCKNLADGPVYALIDNKGNETATKRDGKSDGFEFRPVGQGRQDVKAIMKAIEDTKIQYVIVEQDGHTNGNTSLEDAKASIDYLRSIGY